MIIKNFGENDSNIFEILKLIMVDAKFNRFLHYISKII